MRKSLCLLPLVSALMLTGCVSLAPDYERPEAPVAQAWPADAATANAKVVTEGLAAWSDFFTDERLVKLINAALENNRDLRAAVYNVEKARAQYNVNRANLLPSIAAAGSETARSSGVDTPQPSGGAQHTYSAQAALSSYELDFFGRVRNANEQALQAYFQTEAAQRSAQMTVITDTAQTWLAL